MCLRAAAAVVVVVVVVVEVAAPHRPAKRTDIS